MVVEKMDRSRRDREGDAQIVDALQQYTQAPPTGIDALQPPADLGDRRAQALRAWMLAQQGRVGEAAPLVLELIDRGSGVAYLPMWVGQQLLGQGDPTLRDSGVRMLTYARDDPVAFDPFSTAQQLLQYGDRDGALGILSAAVEGRPVSEREAWNDLIARARSEAGEITASAASAAAERDRLVEEIGSAREAVHAQRDTLTRLVEEVGGLAGVAGATVQANDYGNRANTIERRANWLTGASVGLAALIALGALALAVAAAQADDPLNAALEKAPISIPLLLLNLYIARLASAFREDAVQLRHIELQIRTANPFLGALDDDRRKAVLAMLALRFFPGQSLPVPTHTSEPPDVAAALATLLAPAQRPASDRPRPPGASGSADAAENPTQHTP